MLISGITFCSCRSSSPGLARGRPSSFVVARRHFLLLLPLFLQFLGLIVFSVLDCGFYFRLFRYALLHLIRIIIEEAYGDAPPPPEAAHNH